MPMQEDRTGYRDEARVSSSARRAAGEGIGRSGRPRELAPRLRRAVVDDEVAFCAEALQTVKG